MVSHTAPRIPWDNRGQDHMDFEEVLKLLEQRRNEYRDRADFTVVAIKAEERMAAQIDASIATELDTLITEIRAKLSPR
jgi:hypothetical protein